MPKFIFIKYKVNLEQSFDTFNVKTFNEINAIYYLKNNFCSSQRRKLTKDTWKNKSKIYDSLAVYSLDG